MDYALIQKLSRDNIDSRDAVSAMLGARLQWDADWLGRHCRGRSSGACRLVGGREGAAAGTCQASAPRVVNRHHYKALPAAAVYVGRGTSLGNPYTREVPDALAKYRRWLWDKIKAGDAAVLEALRSIGPDSLLVCSCWPRPCHADVIRAAWCWMREAGKLGT